MRFRGIRHRLINNKLRWTDEDNLDSTDLADDSVGISELSATGTASNTTFLRGDNTWATPAGGGGGGSLTEEEVEDFVGGMVTGNTETGITVTYQDDDGTLDFVVATQSDENFTTTLKDKLDNIATSANNYSHPNHTGEVTSTGDGATVIADNVIDEANLKVSNSPTDGYVLTAQSGNTGGLTWASSGSGGGGSDENFTSAFKTKLEGIETSADVTDSTNVNAAGAVMNSDLNGKGKLLVGAAQGDPTALTVGTDDYVLTADSSEASGVKWAAAGGSGLFSSYALLQDQKSTSTNGGNSAGADTWQTRDLNTEVYDGDNIVTLSNNQFTLAAGTYLIKWGCPNMNGVTDEIVSALVEDQGQTEAYLAYGTGYQSSGTQYTRGTTVLTCNNSTTLEIQQITDGAPAYDYALGKGAWGGINVTPPDNAYNEYTIVEIFKFA